MRQLLFGEYYGADYGMSVTAILSCYGLLKPEEYSESAKRLRDITAPVPDEVKSLISYYQALQVTDEICQYTTNSLYGTDKVKIQKLLEQLETGSPVLLTYFPGEGGGHAVVAYGIEGGTFKFGKK